MSFGVSLRRERELRGISLDEIAKATKISVRLLQAIESDRFEVLPEGVFRKSFIRSYAKYLGINEEKLLHEYDLQVQPSVVSQSTAEKTPPSLKQSSSGSKRALVLSVGILLLVLAAGYRFWYSTRASRRAESTPATQVTSAPAVSSPHPISEAQPPGASSPVASMPASSPPPDVTTGAAGQPGKPVADQSPLKVLGELAKKPDPVVTAQGEGSAPLELTVEASNPAWVSVSSGESTLFSGMMNPSDSKKFSLEAPLKVILGNAGGVRLQVNGQVFSSQGKAGERKTLDISAANYQQYLMPKTP